MTTPTTPYVQVAAALAVSASSAVGQNRLGSLGEQSLLSWPGTPLALGSALLPAAAASAPDYVGPISAVPSALAPARPPAPAQSAQSVAMQAMLNGVESDLREVRNDTRRRVDRSFYVSLGLGVLGGLAVITGVGLAFAGAVPVGITSGIGGAASSIFSGIFSHLYRSESAELRRLVGDLRRTEDARIGLWLADQIQDTEQRDAAVRGLIAQIKQTTDV